MHRGVYYYLRAHLTELENLRLEPQPPLVQLFVLPLIPNF